jgi:hypothetical protein
LILGSKVLIPFLGSWTFDQALSSKLSCGPDNIPNILLKNLHSSLALPLSLIFQQSLNNGCLPKIWKCANIVPVFKGSGSRFSVENYRPISLTSNICKLLEGIIYDKIYDHCLTNKLLSDSQHGFRKNKSTASNLLELTNDLTSLMDKGNNIDLITIDFSKAFDKIPHKKLIHKLAKFGIGGCVFNWICDFLLGRNFKVCINSFNSDLFNVTSSVPQGSKLGPLFYIIYANDIVDLFKFAKITMYADDLTIH